MLIKGLRFTKVWAECGKPQGRTQRWSQGRGREGTVAEGERAVGRLLFRSYGYCGGTQPVLVAPKAGSLFHKWCWSNWTSGGKRMNLTFYININSMHYEHECKTFMKEKIRANLQDIKLGKEFLHLT